MSDDFRGENACDLPYGAEIMSSSVTDGVSVCPSGTDRQTDRQTDSQIHDDCGIASLGKIARVFLLIYLRDCELK